MIWDDNGELKEGEPKDGEAASSGLSSSKSAAGEAPEVATNANSVEERN